MAAVLGSLGVNIFLFHGFGFGFHKQESLLFQFSPMLFFGHCAACDI